MGTAKKRHAKNGASSSSSMQVHLCAHTASMRIVPARQVGSHTLIEVWTSVCRQLNVPGHHVLTMPDAL
jgi:hypothetical protein